VCRLRYGSACDYATAGSAFDRPVNGGCRLLAMAGEKKEETAG